MKQAKTTQIIILLATLLLSCTSRSGHRLDHTKAVRAHHASFSSTSGYKPLPETYIIRVDSLYQPGDIITLGEATFIIDSTHN